MAPNKKHPRQEETSDQLPVPKRPANSHQPSQRSQSVTIQDDDVIEATPRTQPLPPCPPSSSKGAWMPTRLVSTPSSAKSKPSSSNRANSKKSSTTSLANEIQTIITMKATTSNEET